MSDEYPRTVTEVRAVADRDLVSKDRGEHLIEVRRERSEHFSTATVEQFTVEELADLYTQIGEYLGVS